MTRLWMVRGGRRGEREIDMLAECKIFPGFSNVGDLSSSKSRDEFVDKLRQAKPNAEDRSLNSYATQLNQFVNKIQEDDLVVMPRKLTNGVAIGRVTGSYVFDADDVYKHSRTVDWKEESVSRDSFKQDLRHSFGASMTICEIRRNSALERVQSVLDKDGKDPGVLLGKQGIATKQPIEEDAETEDYETDIEDIAYQQIISLIKSEFAGHALAKFVAEILRLEGYTTKISPPGPDGQWH